SLASRFSLVGVLADSSAGGVAIIAVDGAPPKPYRVGAWLADGWMLQSVRGRIALVGSERGGPIAVTLELPALKR
ncbi:MAG: general secretion pathway protein C, partial [Burkholderiales bacterium PBB4]